MSVIHWTRIKEHLLPSIIQEIEMTGNRYVDLINKMKERKTQQVLDKFFQMRIDISKRIEELENYFDDNFGNPRMVILQKGIFQLKKLLFYNPDKNNDLEDSDLKEFRGLTIDLNQIDENFPFKNFTKNNVKKNINKNSKLNNKNNKKEKEDKNNDDDDLIKNLPIKRKLQVRLTNEEYELLQKLKAKKLNTTTTVK
jgi:hypothetical protein